MDLSNTPQFPYSITPFGFAAMFYLRNALLAAYLDGEPASVAILSDFLMEQGEDAGRLHGNASRRLGVVLGLIRPELSHALGCDFAEHVADLYKPGHPHNKHHDKYLYEALEIKRRWLRGEASAEQLKNARKVLLELMNQRQHRWRSVEHHAARAAFCACTLGEHTARDCSAPAIRAAGHAAHLGRSEAKEFQWQFEHLRQALLHSESEAR